MKTEEEDLRDTIDILEDDGERFCARIAELEAAAVKVKAGAYLDDDVLNRHPFTNVSCEALRELFALIESVATKPTAVRGMATATPEQLARQGMSEERRAEIDELLDFMLGQLTSGDGVTRAAADLRREVDRLRAELEATHNELEGNIKLVVDERDILRDQITILETNPESVIRYAQIASRLVVAIQDRDHARAELAKLHHDRNAMGGGG